MVLIARDIVLIDVIDAPVVRMIREFVHGEQETQVGVVLLGGCHTLDLLEDLDDSVDGGRVIGGRGGGGGGGDGRLALDAQQLDELCPEDGEGEALGVTTRWHATCSLEEVQARPKVRAPTGRPRNWLLLEYSRSLATGPSR